MKYRNDTRFPDALLRPLIEWTRSKMDEGAQQAQIRIMYSIGARGNGIAGIANGMAWGAGSRGKGFLPSLPLVRILVSPRWDMRRYPFEETYKQRAGALRYETWQEHFVALVAHELRHVDQTFIARKNGVRTKKEKQAMFGGSVEVDAERHAKLILAEYRRERPQISMESAIAAKEETKECPHCHRSGGIAAMFGWRRVNEKMIPQPYCRPCRAAKVRGEW